MPIKRMTPPIFEPPPPPPEPEPQAPAEPGKEPTNLLMPVSKVTTMEAEIDRYIVEIGRLNGQIHRLKQEIRDMQHAASTSGGESFDPAYPGRILALAAQRDQARACLTTLMMREDCTDGQAQLIRQVFRNPAPGSSIPAVVEHVS